jgi:folate-binding protein YgfZ
MRYARELGWLETSVGVLAPTHRTVISVTGDDAHEWLQGQITNQCEGAKPGDSVYGFILTLKGRVMADAWAYFHETGIWLEVPGESTDALLERLDRYIIMEDVDLEHAADLRLLIAQGPKSGDIAGERAWPSDRLGTGGHAWLVDKAEIDAELESLTHRATEAGGGWVSDEAWHHASVVRGRPRFGLDFGDWTYPQETGLTGAAVSFGKGCYVGQETVVMLQNRGKAPKLLWRWAIDGAEPPGDKAPILKEGAVVGEITSATSVDAETRALGFRKRGHEDEVEGFEVQGRPARPVGPVSEGPGVSLAHS